VTQHILKLLSNLGAFGRFECVQSFWTSAKNWIKTKSACSTSFRVSKSSMANESFVSFGDFYSEIRTYFARNLHDFEEFKRRSSGRKKIEVGIIELCINLHTYMYMKTTLCKTKLDVWSSVVEQVCTYIGTYIPTYMYFTLVNMLIVLVPGYVRMYVCMHLLDN
jgi:hypothetical protein